MATQRKQILANVYHPTTGTLLATWTKFSFDGFTKELNAGPSECVLNLDKLFDYSAADLVLGNEVELRLADKDTTAQVSGTGARAIYRGYISLIERQADGPSEGVVVHILGFYTLLALDVLKNTDQTTLYSNSSSGLTTTSGSQSAADLGLMARAVIDRFRAENANAKVFYDPDGVPNTGTTATYSFQQKTYREALDVLRQMAPSGTFYYIDETGRLSFKTKPPTPTHAFTIGKHFNAVHIEHSLEKVRNVLLLWNGKTDASKVYAHYEDAESIALYGRRVQTASDFGINNADAADLIGTRFITDNKVPDIMITCTIIDNNGQDNFGYDIESVQPGDTCSFYGFNTGFDDIFRDNMLITRVQYMLDRIELQIELTKSGIVDIQQLQGRQIGDIVNGAIGVPESYS